jgi:hypothetical protein
MNTFFQNAPQIARNGLVTLPLLVYGCFFIRTAYRAFKHQKEYSNNRVGEAR